VWSVIGHRGKSLPAESGRAKSVALLAGRPYGDFSCASQVLDAFPYGLGLLLPRPFPPAAPVVGELNAAGLRYGVVAVARVVHLAARPDGYLVGCLLLSPLPGELLRHQSNVVPG
jgi:hypothetical protein